MIDHLSSYTTNYPAAKAFYTAALAALGHSLQTEMVASWDTDFPERRCCAFGTTRPVFWVIEVKDENAATPRHVAFVAADRTAVQAFFDAALAAGGTDHGAPGLRSEYHEHYFGAFILDPDGNNVEAVCHSPVV
jgi:catechol 2,3-dioxygenase-like lactoylglutathione lyase family enzyme